jgi:hypothetical protein
MSELESINPHHGELTLSVSWSEFNAIISSIGEKVNSVTWQAALCNRMTPEERAVAEKFHAVKKHIRLVPSKVPRVPRMFVEPY